MEGFGMTSEREDVLSQEEMRQIVESLRREWRIKVPDDEERVERTLDAIRYGLRVTRKSRRRT